MTNHTPLRRQLRQAEKTGTCPECGAEVETHEHHDRQLRFMGHERDCDVARIAPAYKPPIARTRREMEDRLARIESQIHHGLVDV